ncbi:hypothetical protein [Streptomyces sp. NBC_01264]|uniref:hypothetical protein n=1 Tax=Streptomyces sp. NBC_01264 TaxID=2903804 RepID=UPI002259CD5E|nr:hypothetical protein [Streptomyces sp. NBC_01264]MCX4781760.1 hypothetical protein [Streptomyces sp. NBC_01264]
MTENARAALEHLRDPSRFQWYLIPLLLLVIYVYAAEVERRNWNVFFAGLALWGMDWFNEIWNALVFHFTQRAPAWGAGGDSAFQILIGLNAEICLMFAVMGVAAAKLLPPRGTRLLGIPGRWLFVLLNSLACVGVEVLLHRAGVLTWDWPWWQEGFPFLILLIGYAPFFVVCAVVHDLPRVRAKAAVVSALFAIDAAALAAFGALGWL